MKAKKEAPPKKGVARLLEIAGERRAQLTAACVCAVFGAAARLAPFFTIYAIVREIILHYEDLSAINFTYMWMLVGLTAGFAVLFGIASFTSIGLSHRAAYNILYSLRVRLMEKLARIPSGFFTENTQGGLKKILQDDVERIEGFLAHHIVDIAAAIALPLLTFIYLFIMDWRLALATLLPTVVSLFLLSAGLKNPKGAQTQVEMRETSEKMNGTIVEYVHGMPVIKIFNRTLNAFQRFEGDISAFSNAVRKTAHFFAPAMGVYYAAFGAQLLFVLPAALLCLSSAPSYADFLPVVMLFFLIGSGLKEPLETMMTMALSTKEIGLGVERIDEILNLPEIETAAVPETPVGTDIVFEHVSFRYDKGAQALKDVSFRIDAGSINGLVGPSGGGKSTVMQLLLRFYEPQQGSIKIGGVDIRNISPQKLMDLIGYVFQDCVLFHKSIEENIRMGNQSATREQVINAAKAANIHEVIVSLHNGYDAVIGENDTYLSGGEKQRIAIARVFLKDAPIILLDEATAYADAENESKIQEAFARLCANKTVFIIAHRLKTVEKADCIFLLSGGTLVARGNHRQLLENTVYKNMVKANQRRDTWQFQTKTEKEDTVHA